jgi:hypothetical protein
MLTGRYPVKFYLRTGNVRAVRQGSTAKPKDRQTPDENSSHEDSLLPTFRLQDKIKLNHRDEPPTRCHQVSSL